MGLGAAVPVGGARGQRRAPWFTVQVQVQVQVHCSVQTSPARPTLIHSHDAERVFAGLQKQLHKCIFMILEAARTHTG